MLADSYFELRRVQRLFSVLVVRGRSVGCWVESWAFEALLEEYREHQRCTRGLREQTLDGYERLVRMFVRAAGGGDPIDL